MPVGIVSRAVVKAWGAHGGQLDNGIIAQTGHGFQCHVASALDGPFIVLSNKMAPTNRRMAASFGKMPTPFVRRRP